MFTGAVVPASTVASIATTHTLRPPMRARPVMIASPGDGASRRSSGSASRPISCQEPASTSAVDALARGQAPGVVDLGDAIRSAGSARRLMPARQLRDEILRGDLTGALLRLGRHTYLPSNCGARRPRTRRSPL